jgi:uncharacterized membrane protein YhaH (DUF805 family)
VDWYLKVLRQYADFDGRARRKEFWTFALPNSAVAFVLYLIAVLVNNFTFTIILYSIVGIAYLAILLPTLAVGVRRLHDTGRPGTFLLLALIPIVGGIILLVFMATEGTRGPNQYGPDPKALPGPQGSGYGPGYPGGGYPPGPQGYPAPHGGYPGAHGGYPGPHGGYPAPHGGYPAAQPPGYPTPQAPRYPAPQPGYPAGGPRRY